MPRVWSRTRLPGEPRHLGHPFEAGSAGGPQPSVPHVPRATCRTRPPTICTAASRHSSRPSLRCPASLHAGGLRPPRPDSTWCWCALTPEDLQRLAAPRPGRPSPRLIAATTPERSRKGPGNAWCPSESPSIQADTSHAPVFSCRVHYWRGLEHPSSQQFHSIPAFCALAPGWDKPPCPQNSWRITLAIARNNHGNCGLSRNPTGFPRIINIVRRVGRNDDCPELRHHGRLTAAPSVAHYPRLRSGLVLFAKHVRWVRFAHRNCDRRDRLHDVPTHTRRLVDMVNLPPHCDSMAGVCDSVSEQGTLGAGATTTW
jgi:hypothetical protein